MRAAVRSSKLLNEACIDLEQSPESSKCRDPFGNGARVDQREKSVRDASQIFAERPNINIPMRLASNLVVIDFGRRLGAL